ncbi:MAG: sugar transporter [Pararhodobacter sp.]|nr:sugar transporter [Pararhodobacter sp.]
MVKAEKAGHRPDRGGPGETQDAGPERAGDEELTEATEKAGPVRQGGNAEGEGQKRKHGEGQSRHGQKSGQRGDDSQPKVRPFAQPAKLQGRHRLLVAFVLAGFLLPVVLTTVYLYGFAKDQYASNVGFTVRQEESGSASELLGGLSAVMGTRGSTNTDVLYEFIQSQEIVEQIMRQIDLVEHYSRDWRSDPLFSIWPSATIEDVLWYWRRMVRISYDRNTGLIDVQVRARDAQTAQEIARAIVSESEAMINALNEAARRDTMSHAQRDLEEAIERLREAREALAEFRARTRIVDPQADLQGRMGVLNNLQQQLAEALVEHDLLLQVTNETDPRVRSALRRIEVIRDRIAQERLTFATEDVTVIDTDYPRLLAQFESLAVDTQFGEQSYTAALTALDAARSNAMRQSLYLATYIRPTLSQRAEYPQRLQLVMLTVFFMLLIWSVIALIYYSLRDRG